MPIPHLRGNNTSRAVIVPGTTLGSRGEILPHDPPPPIIRALVTLAGWCVQDGCIITVTVGSFFILRRETFISNCAVNKHYLCHCVR